MRVFGVTRRLKSTPPSPAPPAAPAPAAVPGAIRNGVTSAAAAARSSGLSLDILGQVMTTRLRLLRGLRHGHQEPVQQCAAKAGIRILTVKVPAAFARPATPASSSPAKARPRPVARPGTSTSNSAQRGCHLCPRRRRPARKPEHSHAQRRHRTDPGHLRRPAGNRRQGRDPVRRRSPCADSASPTCVATAAATSKSTCRWRPRQARRGPGRPPAAAGQAAR